jgi:hypothetical protein
MHKNAQHLERTPEMAMVSQEEIPRAGIVVCATTTLGLAVSEASAAIVESKVTNLIYVGRRRDITIIVGEIATKIDTTIIVTETAIKIDTTIIVTEIATKVTIVTETKIGIKTEIEIEIDTITDMVTATVTVIVTIRKVMPSFLL